MVHRIKYEEVSREVGILEVDVTKKMFFELTKFWRFTKATEAGKKGASQSGTNVYSGKEEI